jgi:hypothetical protein
VISPVLDPGAAPIAIDEPALFRLAEIGYRWTSGQTGAVSFRWLLPPGWVGAARLPPSGRGGVERLSGVGDREGRFTAVLGVLHGCGLSPHQLLAHNAAAGAAVTMFSSRTNGFPVAERIERRDGRLTVTTVHAFVAGGQDHRFLISAVGPATAATAGDPDPRTVLRTLGSALALTDETQPLRAITLHG